MKLTLLALSTFLIFSCSKETNQQGNTTKEYYESGAIKNEHESIGESFCKVSIDKEYYETGNIKQTLISFPIQKKDYEGGNDCDVKIREVNYSEEGKALSEYVYTFKYTFDGVRLLDSPGEADPSDYEVVKDYFFKKEFDSNGGVTNIWMK